MMVRMLQIDKTLNLCLLLHLVRTGNVGQGGVSGVSVNGRYWPKAAVENN
jgi:hypothetical protein